MDRFLRWTSGGRGKEGLMGSQPELAGLVVVESSSSWDGKFRGGLVICREDDLSHFGHDDFEVPRTSRAVLRASSAEVSLWLTLDPSVQGRSSSCVSGCGLVDGEESQEPEGAGKGQHLKVRSFTKQDEVCPGLVVSQPQQEFLEQGLKLRVSHLVRDKLCVWFHC